MAIVIANLVIISDFRALRPVHERRHVVFVKCLQGTQEAMHWLTCWHSSKGEGAGMNTNDRNG